MNKTGQRKICRLRQRDKNVFLTHTDQKTKTKKPNATVLSQSSDWVSECAALGPKHTMPVNSEINMLTA